MISLTSHASDFFPLLQFIDRPCLRREKADRWFHIDLQAPRNKKSCCVLAHEVLRPAGPAGLLPVGSFVFIPLISWKSNINTKSLCPDPVVLMVSCTALWIRLLHKVTSGQPIADLLLCLWWSTWSYHATLEDACQLASRGETSWGEKFKYLKNTRCFWSFG